MRGIAVVVACVLGVASCTGAGEPDTPAGAPALAPPASEPPAPVEPVEGVARLQGCEPRSLLPADATTRCGQEVVSGLFSGLVELDPASGAPSWGSEDDRSMAAGLRSIDGRRWVVELEDGWTFHDGEPVTSTSFVDAWNDAAYGPNARGLAHLFDRILGYGEVSCPDPGCDPTRDRMLGLRVVDELTFEITLASPYRDLPRLLGHPAFAPLPTAAFEDPDAWAEAPVGNGPLRMEGAWEHDRLVRLRAWEDYTGAPAAAAGVDVVLYQQVDRAWTDLQDGDLDVADALAPGDAAAARGRFERVVAAGDDVEFLVVPSYLPAYDDPRLARALSMAIDRRAIVREVYGDGTRPAQGLVPPVASDEADRCGATCRFRPEQARALFAAAGGVPEGGIELWFDRDTATQEAWVRAVARQWRRVLRLAPGDVRVQSLPHTSWVSHLQDRRAGGPYALGWSADVPGPREYLEELHTPGGLFDFDGYAELDALDALQRAARASTPREARLAYRAAEQLVLEDMHHIPLWTRSHEVFHVARVRDVRVDGRGQVGLADLVVTS